MNRQLKRNATYSIVFLTWLILSLMGFYIIKDRWGMTWDWLLCGFGIVICLNSYIRKNSQIVIGLILAITFGAISLLNVGIVDFPRWQIWSIFFISCGLSLLILWTRRFLKSWILLPGGILLFAGGIGFGEKNWWQYQRTLREIMDLWPLLLIFMTAILLISRNINREQKRIVDKW